KPASAITRESPAPMPRGKAAAPSAQRAASASSPAALQATRAQGVPSNDTRTLPGLPASVRVTHPERVIDAKSGLTKRDLVDYYLHAAKKLLPHLKGRPVALVRAPAG